MEKLKLIENLEGYGKYYSVEKFTRKLKKYGLKAGANVVYMALLLFYVLTSEKVSLQDKLNICGALGYLILPMDLIPDSLPMLGFSDDLTALVWCYRHVKSNVTPEMQAQAKEKLRTWFPDMKEDELEIG